MKQRIITAGIALVVLAPFLIFSDTFMLLIFSSVLSAVALYEMLGCIGLRKNPAVIIPVILVSTAAVVMTRIVSDGYRYLAFAFIIFFVLIVYLMTASVLSRGKVDITHAGLAAVTSIYIIMGFASIVLLRDINYGQYIFLISFLVPWISDSGAYFIGVNFGRHKLIPEVSPKKTVEGFVGGIVFGTLSVLLYGFIISIIFEAQASYPALLAAGLIISVVSQCGDLIASLIKRHWNVKDYGFVFPGHGGVMDRFDSIIAVAPFLYMLCMLSSFFEIFF